MNNKSEARDQRSVAREASEPSPQSGREVRGRKKFYFLFSVLCLLCSISALPQTNESTINPTKQYDEIIDLNKVNEKVQEIIKDELFLLLPKLGNALYQNWIANGEPLIWTKEAALPDFINIPEEILQELEIEKVLKQSYERDEHLLSIIIYKFKTFTGAYSAYTILHTGATTKLKVGRHASESDKALNFWKGNYYITLNTDAENDKISKEFIILGGQEISKNIQTEQLPPVVAIQLPSLGRIQGSEKYCLGTVCVAKYFPFIDLDLTIFNLKESGGIISAEYQFSDDTKDKERITLFLTRYLEKETAQSIFDSLKEVFERKKESNKDIDITLEDSTLQIKNKKDDYIMLKQKGNLLAIAFNIKSKKSGEKVLSLVPWPIEIEKPTIK